LALAALALQSLFVPTSDYLLSLALSALGLGAGLSAYTAAGRPDEPSLLHLNPGGWVALGLLGLATVVLGVRETRTLVWGDSFVSSPGADSELDQVRARIATTQAQLDALKNPPRDDTAWNDPLRSRPDTAGGVNRSGVVDLSTYWKSRPPERPGATDAPGTRAGRLEQDLKELQDREAVLEAARAKGRSGRLPLAPRGESGK
jgi:hypothetical protein